MFKDFYDEELVRLGGQHLIDQRSQPLRVSTQFNLLRACGFRVPHIGLIREFLLTASTDIEADKIANDGLLVLPQPGNRFTVKSIDKVQADQNLLSSFAFLHIPAKDEHRTRYYIISANIFKFDVWAKHADDYPYEAFTDKQNHDCLEFSDVEVCDLHDRRHKELIKLAGSFYPMMSIDTVIASSGEEYAVSYDSAPKLSGTPLENIATASQLAAALLNK